MPCLTGGSLGVHEGLIGTVIVLTAELIGELAAEVEAESVDSSAEAAEEFREDGTQVILGSVGEGLGNDGLGQMLVELFLGRTGYESCGLVVWVFMVLVLLMVHL